MKANIDAAEKALTKLKGKAPKMGTSISKYQQEKAAWQEQIDNAQRVVDYWQGVKSVQNTILAQESAERRKESVQEDGTAATGSGESEGAEGLAVDGRVNEEVGLSEDEADDKKEKSASASSSDIETEPEGKRNGTATPQNGTFSIVHNRHTQTNQQAETGEGSLNAEQSGTQTKTSTMPSTSERKSTNNSSNNGKNVEEKSEVAESNAVKDANKLASDYKNAAEKAAAEAAEAEGRGVGGSAVGEGGVREQKAEGGLQEASAEDKVLAKAAVDLFRKAGLDVVDDVEEGQRVLDMANGRGMQVNSAKKRALETASLAENKQDLHTVVSSADGAKVLNNIDTLKKDYENLSKYPSHFVGDIANALGAVDGC